MDTLESERLLIRELQEGDREACRDLLSVEFDYYYGPFDDNPDLDMRFNWLVSLTQWKSAGGIYGDHAILLKDTGQIIGLCGIDPWIWKAKTKRLLAGLFPEAVHGIPCTTIEFELGYALKTDYRGQGYATEGVLCLINWAFEVAEIAEIYARTDENNLRSIAMMNRIGMETCASETWGGTAGRLRNPEAGPRR